MGDHKQAREIYFLARSVVSLWLPNVIERNKRCSKMLSLRYIANILRLAGFHSQSFFTVAHHWAIIWIGGLKLFVPAAFIS